MSAHSHGTSAGSGFAVGVVHYRSPEDLQCCLDSLAAQTRPPVCVRVYDVVDAAGDDEAPSIDARVGAVRRAHPDVVWLSGPNIGFAAAANRLLVAGSEGDSPVGLQLIANADITFDPDHLEQLEAVFEHAPDIAIAGGKLLRPGRELVDSAGIRLPAHARPRDRGSELPDGPEWSQPQDVFAVSGAAMAIRTAALAVLSLADEVFDEDFFMYHEDTDLCWRAGRLGMRVRYVPEAIAVHRRGWRKDERFAQPAWIRRHSFKNHYLQLVKNETPGGWLRRAPALVVWEGLRLGFAVLRDRAMLSGYAQALAALPDARRKRRQLNARING